MRKRICFRAHSLWLVLALFLVAGGISAQTSLLKGKVTDVNNEPLIGVNVIEKGTNNGTVTDIEGRFSLNASSNATIVFSYIGFTELEVARSGRTVLDVTLEEDMKLLDEVVITALGIKREARQLGYSTENLDGESIANTMPANWSAGLSGKVAGLNIVSPGGPIGSTRISLRGDVSLNVNGNNALIVVDGVPMSNTISNPGNGLRRRSGGGTFHRLWKWFCGYKSQ